MKFKIVYLDDEPDLLELFKEIFGTPDYEIVVFSDDASALSYIQESKPDLVVLDYLLKQTTGDKVASKMDRSITKILLTGEDGIAPLEKFEAVFKKPFEVSKIREFLKLMHAKKVRL